MKLVVNKVFYFETDIKGNEIMRLNNLFLSLMMCIAMLSDTRANNNDISSVKKSTNTVKSFFTSDEKRTALIELYTSEGCSSCPPADKWLSGLKQSPKLWSTFVPVAFHVDYWDKLGWDDRFAKPEYSQRQRRYATENAKSTIYTPGVRVGGEIFNSWRSSDLDRLKKANKVGVLSINVDDAGGVIANFKSAQKSIDKLVLNIAVLAMNVSTEVKEGENHGKVLAHDFVVLEHFISKGETNGPMTAFKAKLPTQYLKQLEPTTHSRSYALAAWVNKKGALLPIQATGGYL